MNDVAGISDRLRYRLPLSILFSLSFPCNRTEAVSNVHQWETEIMGRRQLLATTQFAYFPWDLSPTISFFHPPSFPPLFSFLRSPASFFLTWPLRRKDNGQEWKDFRCFGFKRRQDLEENKPKSRLHTAAKKVSTRNVGENYDSHEDQLEKIIPRRSTFNSRWRRHLYPWNGFQDDRVMRI